jgi:hypothetical protein
MKFSLSALVALVFCTYGGASPGDSDSVAVAIRGSFHKWDGLNLATAESLDRAVQSHEEACANWVTETRTQMGARVRYLECGNRMEEKVGPYFSKGLAEGFVGSSIGYLVSSRGTILVNVPSGYEIKSLDREVAGEAFSFTHHDFPTMLAAYEKARRSYDKKCHDWRERVRKQFDDSFVYASCGFVTGDSPYLTANPPAWKLRFLLWSQGTIYYLKAKD